MILSLPKGFQLFRSDINKPPEKWDQTHINPTYNYKGFIKNKTGNLFFFDNAESANTLGKTYDQSYHFLTSCCVNIDQCKIIDFSQCCSVYMMFRVLDELGIDVLTDNFKLYSECLPPYLATFKELATAYKETKAGNSFSVYHVKYPGKTAKDIGIIGQRLTDFDNGLAFKKIIDSFGQPLHGYRWCEQNAPACYSYCIFSSKIVSDPITEKVEVNKINGK